MDADQTSPPSDPIARVTAAQTRMYARYADLSQAWAELAQAQTEFNEALTDFNRAVDRLAQVPQQPTASHQETPS